MLTQIQIRKPCPACHEYDTDTGDGWHDQSQRLECHGGYVFEWVDAHEFIKEHQHEVDQS